MKHVTINDLERLVEKSEESVVDSVWISGKCKDSVKKWLEFRFPTETISDWSTFDSNVSEFIEDKPDSDLLWCDLFNFDDIMNDQFWTEFGNWVDQEDD